MTSDSTSDLIGSLGFPLDRFQRDAVDAIESGRSVLVAAPTGAGKTVVAEFAVADAVGRGLRAFYTTPIKALSNQKYADLLARYGRGKVGLLTGDNSIDGDADIVVMTTEVLRNMIYAGRDLDGLGVVVLDEVHYLQDNFRGPVWEEVIIHLPEHVRLVCLSATVSNADEIGTWLETIRGATDVVVEETRPVELAHTYLVGERAAERLHHLDVLVDGRPNPEADRFDVQGEKRRSGSGPRDRRPRGGGRGGRQRRPWYTPGRTQVLDFLDRRDLLPTIVFIFSRAACDDAVRACIESGASYTTTQERDEIDEIVSAHLGDLSAADLRALDATTWRAGLLAGVAAHHAGHVPPFKEAVEACFVRGLVKAVYATETLALGVNMPARSVVIERLTKYNGERRELLTPAQYTQLTGRAGRRGIDSHGTAVTLWSPFIQFGQLAGLAGSRSFALRSAFRPTYNMAANLVRRHDEDEAHRLLNQSLAQFQTDREVVELERRAAKHRRTLTRVEADASCELGSVSEYRRLLVKGRPRAGHRDIAAALASLSPGDVLRLEDGPRVAVLSVAYRRGGVVRVKSVTEDREVVVLEPQDFDDLPAVSGAVELPVPYQPDDAAFRAEVASRLTRSRTRTARTAPVVDHPVASCPDAATHVAALERADRVRHDLTALERRIQRRTGTLSARFSVVVGVLESFGYLDGWSLTERGELLAGIYHEAELVVAEAVLHGCFDGLDAAELAAVASTLVYERRAPGPPPPVRFPSRNVRERCLAVAAVADRVNVAEEEAGLPQSRGSDPGFAHLVHSWCLGVGLGPLLESSDLDLSGGDFVRTARQLTDLLRQLAQLVPDPRTRVTARQALDLVRRGVVVATVAEED